MKKQCILSFLIFFLFVFYMAGTVSLSAQTGGNNIYEFLNLSNSARSVALGGNCISIKDNDLNLSYQNPSVLDSTMHNSLSLSYINYFADIQYGYVAYSRTYKKIGSFSAGIQYADYGNFTSANVTGEIIGQFYASEYAFNLSYARPLDSLFSVGGTLKTIYSKLEQYSSYGNALDIGAIYNNRKLLFSAALVVKNMGMQWKTYDIVREPLPFEIQLGVSKKIPHAPFRVNFTVIHLEKWDLTYINPAISTVDPITGTSIEKSKANKFANKLARHFVFGGEVLISKNFHIRLGYNHQRRQELKLESHSGISGFSFGFGLKVLKFHLSYGYARYHMAGGPNHFTIGTNFSEFYSKK